jgi:hypothetical protein
MYSKVFLQVKSFMFYIKQYKQFSEPFWLPKSLQEDYEITNNDNIYEVKNSDISKHQCTKHKQNLQDNGVAVMSCQLINVNVQ